MNDIAREVHKITDMCVMVGGLAAIPIALGIFVAADKNVPKSMPFKERVPGPLLLWIVLCLVLFGCALIGTGACVVGGYLSGKGVCEVSLRHDGHLHPVKDFVSIQIFYAVQCLVATVVFGLTLVRLIVTLLPGGARPPQKMRFVLTFGRRGRWK